MSTSFDSVLCSAWEDASAGDDDVSVAASHERQPSNTPSRVAFGKVACRSTDDLDTKHRWKKIVLKTGEAQRA